METSAPILRVARLRRRPARGAAIDGFGIDIGFGELVVLLGDAGSGAATLIRVLAGCDAADGGEVRVAATPGGRITRPLAGSRRAAIRAGIGLVDPGTLAGEWSGLDNVLLGSESFWRPWRGRRGARVRLVALQNHLDLAVDLDLDVRRLAAGDRLRIALLRALARRPRVLLLEDPPDLSLRERTHLVAVLRRVAAEGTAVVFATARPEDAIAAAGRIVVVCSGQKITECTARDGDAAWLLALMTDQPLDRLAVARATPGGPLLRLERVDAAFEHDRMPLRGVSLDLREREIVAIAGHPGHGQATLTALFAGLTTPAAGELHIRGRSAPRLDPALSARLGLARIPGDCRADGIVPEMSVAENGALDDIAGVSRRGLVAAAALRARGERLLAQSGIEDALPDDRVGRLCDVDVRKFVLARVFDRQAGVIIADHPTRGLDLVGRRAVHRRLIAERDRGAGILLVSDDIEEIMLLADQVGVLFEGRLTIPQPAGVIDRTALAAMMTGHGSLAQDWSGWGEGA